MQVIEMPKAVTQALRNPVDANLDYMLAGWHRWKSEQGHAQGYKPGGIARYAESSNHWDWLNGAEDDRAEEQMMRGFDEAIDTIPDEPRRWRLALCFEARNLSTGFTVWSSPRLPQDPGERETLVLEARNKLLQKLHRSGLW